MFWTKPNEICPFPKWQNQPTSNKNRTSSTLAAYQKICTKNCVSSGFVLKASCVQNEDYIRKQKCHHTRYNVRIFIKNFPA